ncbi:MAG: hypothetical protein L6V93_11795 [Clostridiales bacterium]|nr:MAG: hypothetical protein L6V93_11795 [Clostridiales bacterium]
MSAQDSGFCGGSVITLKSRMPISAILSVRGMGVALNVRTFTLLFKFF